MARISQMPVPAIPLSGLELIPAIQGGGADANVGLPLLTSGPPYGGAVLALRRAIVADMGATSEADPGAGNVRWNHVSPGSATEIYVSDEDADAGDLATVFAALDGGGYLYLQGAADSEARDNWQRWQVTAVIAETGYTKVGVTLQASGGAFANDDALELTVQQPLPSPGVDRNVVTTVSSSSNALTLDASLGDYFRVTLSENVDTLVVANVPAACTLALWIKQASAGYEFAWPAEFNWGVGEAEPAVDELADGEELFLVISTYDAGGTWDAVARQRE